MKKITIKSLLIAAALCLGTSAWAVEETEYSTLWNQNFETESEISTNISLNASRNGKYSLNYASGNGAHYLCVMENSVNGGNGIITLPSYSDFDEYILRFDWGGYCSNKKNSSLILRNSDTDVLTITYGTSTSATVTIGSSTEALATTLTTIANNKATRNNPAVTKFYSFEIKGTATGTNLKIYDGENVIIEEKLSEQLLPVTSMVFYLGNALSQMGFDNIVLKAYSSVEIVPNPIAKVSGVNGKERTITMELSEGTPDGSSIYYYTTENEDEGLHVKYTTPFTTENATSIYYYAKSAKGTKSETQMLATTAGTENNLTKPSIVRNGANKYSISSVELVVDGYKVPQTIHYTIGNNEEQTSTATSVVLDGVDGDIEAWATAEGFAQTEKSNKKYVAPIIAKEVWAYNLNSYPTSKSVTSITDAINTEAKITVGGVEAYNLKDIEYANLFVENTSNWLLRNQAANAWKAQSGRANIIINNVSESDVIYVYSRRDVGGAGVYSVTNGSIKYDYNSIEYFIVPNGTDPVVININNGCAVNNISVSTTKVPTAITAAGYATFSSTYAVDFSESGLEAYTAKVNDGNQTITLTKIDNGIVPANTGVILKGVAGDYTGVITTTNANVDNDLKANATEITGNGSIYVLNNGTKGIGFYQLAETGTLAAGKAYLEMTSNAKAYTFVWNESTGIEENYEFGTMNSDAATYDLSGRKVANPAKGLYIKNGKKFIVK